MSWTDPAGVVPNVNPNEPSFPFGGGSDNPGDNTANPGGPTNLAATETGPPTIIPHVDGAANAEGIHPAVVSTLAQTGTDTPLPAGTQAVPAVGTGFEGNLPLRSADPSGGVTVDPISGTTRESGQDETVGETETSPGVSPAAFPEPNP